MIALDAAGGRRWPRLFIPVSYRIGAPARIEGAVQRIVAAPLDGYLAKAHVRPGDSVRAGDLLVELADQDLLLEQRRWEGALAQHENGYAAALARADRAQFVITQGKAGEARAQLDLVRQQLSRTRLLAPIDGIVIKGDLSQGLGAPVQRGDSLITIAPAEQYRLIINVDERDIAGVAPGQRGQTGAGVVAGRSAGLRRRAGDPGCRGAGRPQCLRGRGPAARRRAAAAARACRALPRSKPANARLPGSGPTAPSTGCAWPSGRWRRSHDGIAVQRPVVPRRRAAAPPARAGPGAAPAVARPALVPAVGRGDRAPAPDQRRRRTSSSAAATASTRRTRSGTRCSTPSRTPHRRRTR